MMCDELIRDVLRLKPKKEEEPKTEQQQENGELNLESSDFKGENVEIMVGKKDKYKVEEFVPKKKK